MRIRTVVLRTPTFDYFHPNHQPFDIIHDFRSIDPSPHNETHS